MEVLIEKKKGNPNFGKKPVQSVSDLDRIYDFELINGDSEDIEMIGVIPISIQSGQSAKKLDAEGVQRVGQLIHDIIMDEMENLGKIPILLNTSFNIKGKPILTTIKDAIEVLEETEIDHIIVENYIFSRAKND